MVGDGYVIPGETAALNRGVTRSESEMVRVQAHIGLAGRRKNESAQRETRAAIDQRQRGRHVVIIKCATLWPIQGPGHSGHGS